MKPLMQLIVTCALVLAAFLLIAPDFATDTAALNGPMHLLIFLLVLVAYLVPTAIAIYRNCIASVWIILLDILLGWTLVGWAGALGWAIVGKTRRDPIIQGPPSHQHHPLMRS
ncbi:MAG: superinfection immunity protein [Acidobacteriota bacterium]|nr:superinfection immunity protein [Acidobacteriota bacterium]